MQGYKMNQNLVLKSIKDIIFEKENEIRKFFIPSYQRGYRWDKQQVKDLLDDIYDFFQSKRSKDEFYCLQPVVIRYDKTKMHFKVIDGQQRLTTLYIILKYLKESSRRFNDIKKELNNNDEVKDIFEYCDLEDFEVTEPYNIEYETRQGNGNYDSKKFLTMEITKNEIDDSNPDFYHMSIAYQTIKKWFKNKQKKQFYETLLNDTKVIWYQVDCKDEKEEIEIFTRLNIGKIQLTNAELIKAKLLIPIEDYKKQMEFSTVWDNIEQTLQNDDFWYFLTNKQKSQTAIDLIFDVLAQKYKQDFNKKKKDDEGKINYNEMIDKFSYYVFEYVLKNGYKTEEQIWQESQELYRAFLNWYNDRDIYHKVGYLIYFKTSLLNLINEYKGKKKDEFNRKLKSIIIDEDVNDINLVDLKYKYDEKENKIKHHKEKIHKILLLFNIETILQNKNSNVKFDFFNLKFIRNKNVIKKRSWDIEHIASQTDNENKEEWVRAVLKYIYGIDTDKKESIDRIKKIAQNKYEIFYKRTKRELKINDINEGFKHNIGNLTLLDSKTNRGYGNAFFPVKRAIVINEDTKGNFIPIATKNVFLKQYSTKLSDMMNWNEKDIKNYREEIFKLLSKYGIKNEEHSDEQH